MRFAFRASSVIALLIAVLLGGIVLVPRAVYGAPKGNWLTWQPVSGCELPCWRGIVPGKTSVSQAMVLLQHIPDVQIARIGPSLGDSRTALEIRIANLNSEKIHAVLYSAVPISESEDSIVWLILFSELSPAWTLAGLIETIGTMPDLQVLSVGWGAAQILWHSKISTLATIDSKIKIRLCDAGFESLPIDTIALGGIEPSDNVKTWAGYGGLKDAFCTASR